MSEELIRTTKGYKKISELGVNTPDSEITDPVIKDLRIQAKNAYERLKSKVIASGQTMDDVCTIGMVQNIYTNIDTQKRVDKISYLANINDIFNVKANIILGRLFSSSFFLTNPSSTVLSRLFRKIKGYTQKTKSPTIFVRGQNCPINNSGISDKTYTKIFNSDNFSIKDSNKAYTQGYIDFPEYKLRVIYADSSDTTNTTMTGYNMSQEQLNNAKNALDTLPSNYRVLVFVSLCPLYAQDDSTNFANSGMEVFRNLLWGFSQKNSFTKNEGSLSLQWDYTNTTSKLIGIVCGSKGLNNTYLEPTYKMQYLIRQGNLKLDNSEYISIPSTATKDALPNDSYVIDMISVSETKLYITRIGVGGSSRDVEINL